MAKLQTETMEFLGEYKGYKMWRNKDGMIEGYRSIGVVDDNARIKTAKELKRVVTLAKNEEEFKQYVDKRENWESIRKKAQREYNPYEDGNQLKIDINETNNQKNN